MIGTRADCRQMAGDWPVADLNIRMKERAVP
jgi:hypothetical protein